MWSCCSQCACDDDAFDSCRLPAAVERCQLGNLRKFLPEFFLKIFGKIAANFQSGILPNIVQEKTTFKKWEMFQKLFSYPSLQCIDRAISAANVILVGHVDSTWNPYGNLPISYVWYPHGCHTLVLGQFLTFPENSGRITKNSEMLFSEKVTTLLGSIVWQQQRPVQQNDKRWQRCLGYESIDALDSNQCWLFTP